MNPKSVLILIAAFILMASIAGCTSSSKLSPHVAELEITTESTGYTSYMSSAPGLDLEIVRDGTLDNATTVYEWKTDTGNFLTWNPPDFTVTKHGQDFVNDGSRVWWSYLENNPLADSPVTVAVVARDTESGRITGSGACELAYMNGLWQME